MLKILFLLYLLALWFWNAWHQANHQQDQTDRVPDPVRPMPDPVG